MMLGTEFCNTCPLSHDLMAASDKWISPIFAVFFVISGAELELGVFTDWAIVVIGLVYIIFRCLGKYFGARISADLTKADPNVRKYRTLNDIAYAYITEATEESLSAEARDTGATHPRKHAILSEPTVAQSTQELPRSPSPMPGVSEDGEDYTSDDSGSHHADKFWWSEI
jgi:hypothetical protein